MQWQLRSDRTATPVARGTKKRGRGEGSFRDGAGGDCGGSSTRQRRGCGDTALRALLELSATCCVIIFVCNSAICDASVASAFQTPPPLARHLHRLLASTRRPSTTGRALTSRKRRAFRLDSLPIDSFTADDEALATWVAAFASTHIGMSAVRTSIISRLGRIAGSLELVDNETWTLPRWWPGDDAGGNRIFPDEATAGRQLYRALYTLVSFATLGSAFVAYLRSSGASPGVNALGSEGLHHSTQYLHEACLCTAALSFGAAIASLFNASPLGLMPAFEAASASSNDENAKEGEAVRSDSIAGALIIRDDARKFTARGLTRITRHPLILPVVPWGAATAILAGGRTCDFILFGGLSIYAVAGCFAQDLRVIREEGSVGTVFVEGALSGAGGVGDAHEGRRRLSDFFNGTSFVPFKAVFDGRQRFGDIVVELPWLQLVIGTMLGMVMEERILQLLSELSV